MNGIWSLGQAMSTKCILVVDEDVDVQDIADVTLKVLNNIDPERDIQFTLGPVDSLDHASRLPDFGSKMGVDATRKWPSEGFMRPWPDEIRMDEKTKERVTKRVEGVRVGVNRPPPHRLLDQPGDFPLVKVLHHFSDVLSLFARP